jgi:Probable Zinc-ribbon domain/PilZ domain
MPNTSESYNLYALRPDLAKEWHPTRNGNLGPKDVTPGSRKKIWWLCEEGHWWLASVRCRTRGMRCSLCLSVQKHGYQRMAAVKPELLKEWHPSRNWGLKAGEVSVNHREKMWWLCAQGHEWEATIRSRLRGKSCPNCCNAVPRVLSNGDQRIGSAPQKTGNHLSFSTPTGLATFNDGLAPSYAGAELRKSVRYARSETVMVEKPHCEILGYAQLKNFSAEGMMLFLDFAMHPGEFIKIRFDKPLHSSFPEIVASRVVWCRDLENQEETLSGFGIGLCLM